MITDEKRKQVGATIIQQLGGKRFIAMTGAKDFSLATGLGIHFKIGRNHKSINWVTINLEESTDTYSMKFEKVRLSRKTYDVKRTLIAEHDMVYCDMLRALFTSATGLHTSL